MYVILVVLGLWLPLSLAMIRVLKIEVLSARKRLDSREDDIALLTAENDTLLINTVSDKMLGDFIRRNPENLSSVVVKALAAEGLAHSWERIGTGTVSQDDGAKKSPLISEKCRNCGLIHRYFTLAPLHEDYEGFFRGGEKVTDTGCLNLKRNEKDDHS